MHANKFYKPLIFISIFFLLCVSMSFAQTSIKVIYNQEELKFDVPPQIVNGRTLVPLRKIFETYGMKVDWNGNTSTVTASSSTTTIVFKIGSSDAYVNSELKKLDVPATIINGRTLVPIRFISESIGATVDWDSESETVTIKTTQSNENINTQIPTVSHFLIPKDTFQLVIVKSTDWTSSFALVQTWQRNHSWEVWQLLKSESGRIGYNGMLENRIQGSGQTPAGLFRILWGFGSVTSPNPNGMIWRKTDSDDYWVYDKNDPYTYNTYQPNHPQEAKWQTSNAERLITYGNQYKYAWVIDYNLPEADKLPDVTKGGGIFFHVNGSGATAGCVSVPEDRMASISEWLDPKKNPVIIIGEDDWLKS